MSSVHFIDTSYRIDVPEGSTVLQAARAVGAPVGSNCGGCCACSGCHVVIEEGSMVLSEMDDDEETLLSTAHGITEGSRLACQAEIVRNGTVTVRITPETRDAYEHRVNRAG